MADVDTMRDGAPGGDAWMPTYAAAWAGTVLEALTTPFPWQAQHMSSGPDDCDVTPWVLHPCFHASLDWHSSCHMQWSGIRLLDLASEHIDPAVREGIVAQLDERLTPENAAVEARYLREHPGYERPYGWAWAAVLAVGAGRSSQEHAPVWAEAARLVADAAAENLLAWMPKLTYPVRTGQHDNTAFGLLLLREAFGELGRADVVEAIDVNTRRWYLADVDWPTRFEPSGNDFLSPGLCEAELMSQVLSDDEFRAWLPQFLPGLGADGDPLLELARVGDRSDGKLVHLFGLELSRASSLRALAPYLDEERQARIAEVTPQQIAHAEREIVEGDFMSTHWLVSFALRAVGVR